ncbi:MAG: phosphoribosylamine--glycine ligase [Proteobacteria bacterium]|nr:phosphoribosylamine--glycine ligase [Pseudomonadota bacterium]
MVNVLLVGGGARESALAYKMSQSSYLSTLYLVGCNPTASGYGQVVSWPSVLDGSGFNTEEKFDGSRQNHLKILAGWCKSHAIDLVVSGPEAPICAGLSDILAQQDIPCFAPSAHLSQLEGSKTFAKQLMIEAGIPTARFSLAHAFDEARQLAVSHFIRRHQGVVIKADGLAGGKGVFVCHTEKDVSEALERLSQSMAKACPVLLCEDLLHGEECSYFAMISGDTIIPMGFVRDYKRLRDGDLGPNTGGMGAYTPLPWLEQNTTNPESMVISQVIQPLIKTLKQKNLSYTGFLYVGLMWTESGPQVLEFNIRLGDPEAQVLALADQRDWLGCMRDVMSGHGQPSANLRPTVGVVMTSPHYPWNHEVSTPCLLPQEVWQSDGKTRVFGAAVRESSDGFYAKEGRILTIVSQGQTLAESRESCYRRAQFIKSYWPNSHMRTDIAELP